MKVKTFGDLENYAFPGESNASMDFIKANIQLSVESVIEYIQNEMPSDESEYYIDVLTDIYIKASNFKYNTNINTVINTLRDYNRIIEDIDKIIPSPIGYDLYELQEGIEYIVENPYDEDWYHPINDY